MKILNTELEFDFTDADDMQKLEEAVEKTQNKLNNINEKGRKTSEVIREVCNYIFDCFNLIFGEGTDKKIFGTKVSFDSCVKAFCDLKKARFEQESKLSDEINKVNSMYSPNRATRRAKK